MQQNILLHDQTILFELNFLLSKNEISFENLRLFAHEQQILNFQKTNKNPKQIKKLVFSWIGPTTNSKLEILMFTNFSAN
jgi:hypothetical protein